MCESRCHPDSRRVTTLASSSRPGAAGRGPDRGRRRAPLPRGQGRDREAALGAEPPAHGHDGAAGGVGPVRARAEAAGPDADRVHRRGAEGRPRLGRPDRLGAAAPARRAAAADEPRGRGRGARAGRRGPLAARGRGGQGLHDRARRARPAARRRHLEARRARERRPAPHDAPRREDAPRRPDRGPPQRRGPRGRVRDRGRGLPLRERPRVPAPDRGGAEGQPRAPAPRHPEDRGQPAARRRALRDAGAPSRRPAAGQAQAPAVLP